MKLTSTRTIAAGAALLFAGTATLAKDNQPTNAAVRDVRPADGAITVSALNLPNSSASDKSQGLPNANGGKPGNGNGYGHLKDIGLGHGNGKGHGHDGEPESP
jgi:hypothetical protein